MAETVLGSTADLRRDDDRGEIEDQEAQRPATRPPSLASDRGARLVVWGCWAAASTAALVAVLRGARNVPIQEDWHVIPAATGYQDNFLAWLWHPNNEHRVPLPKLLYAGLLRLWTDFRVGMIVSMLLLVVVSAAFVVVARRIRGRTRWTDAFFPLALLHLGHWENMGWSWQITFVLATALACGVLLALASGRPMSTVRGALFLSGCLVLIPLSGATALPFAPVVAVVTLFEARRTNWRVATVLRAGAMLTLAVTAVSIAGIQHPSWIPPSPGMAADVRTSFKVLALSFGPAAGAWWLASAVAALAVFAVAAFVLLRARAWSLLAFLGSALLLAALVGHSRASLVPYYGVPDRYVVIALPGLLCAYLAFERARPGGWARHGQAVLCAGLLALYPLNAVLGAEFRDWYHQRVDTFAGDVAAGVPLEELGYYRPIAADAEAMRRSMWILHQRRVGVFSQLNETGPGRAPTIRVDGLDAAASVTGGAGAGAQSHGWVTVGDSSVAAVEGTEGDRRISWSYDVTDSWAAVGRSFPEGEDWRGMGAVALSVSGEGSGRTMRLRLGVAGSHGTVDRFDTLFVDDRAGRRSIVIPWNGFGHVDVEGVFDLKGPLPLDRILSLTFIAMEPGAGRLTIHGVSLVPGHGQVGWPFHPSAARKSLPPWR